MTSAQLHGSWRRFAVAAAPALALALAAGCSNASSPKPEAGTFKSDAAAADVPVDVAKDGAAEQLPNECDPVKQDCPGSQVCGLHCDSSSEHFACADETRGGGGQGQACSVNSDCVKGTICLQPSKSPRACTTYCDKDHPSTCPSGATCTPTTISLACGHVQSVVIYLCY